MLATNEAVSYENLYCEDGIEIETGKFAIYQMNELHALKQNHSESNVLDDRSKLNNCLSRNTYDLIQEENDNLNIQDSTSPQDMKYQPSTIRRERKHSLLGSETFDKNLLKAELQLEANVPCEAVHGSFGTLSPDEPKDDIASNSRQSHEIPHKALMNRSSSLTFENNSLESSTIDSSVFLPAKKSNSLPVHGGSSKLYDASIIMGSENVGSNHSVCCGMMNLGISEEVRSDPCAAFGPIKVSFLDAKNLIQSLDQANDITSDQLDFLLNGSSPSDSQKDLFVNKPSEYFDSDFSILCTSESSAVPTLRDDLEINSLKSNVESQEDFLTLKQQQMVAQITSTPVKLENVLSPTTLNTEILEGSYTGNCYHRDGSRLSKLEAIVTALPLVFNKYSLESYREWEFVMKGMDIEYQRKFMHTLSNHTKC